MPNGDTLDRSHLPIPDPQWVGLTTYDAKDPDTKFPPITPVRPPAGAPNVLIILIDDAGFGSSSAFGGPCNTPTFERLAADGLKYTRFHTTALCSPTRAALLSGRNHHSVGMGGITEIATSAPGYSSLRPKSMAPLAETLKLNGYSTAQFGKCHEVPVWETSPMGPFDRWPSPGNGFEHFYGFIGGETNQYAPAIYRDTVPVEPDRTPEQGYHFTEDMTDQAIDWVRQQKALMPDKPFFVYYAPGATHAPHHVAPEWSDKYKGKFDQGWDKVRDETFARQKELGVIPSDAELTARPTEIPSWEEMPDDLKPVLARQMEVYAGFMEHTDHHLGRFIDALSDLDILDDTLVYCIIGDNGASAEGTPRGTFNELMSLNGAAALETTEFMAAHIDEFGTPAAYNHYAVGWAHAMDTPYQWTKQVASHWGGVRNGTIVRWPNGIKAKGEIRHQFQPRHRRGADGPRGGRPAGPDVRQRHPAGAARGRLDGVHVRRRRRGRAAHDSVLRDVRQPRHLSPGLDRGHPPLDAMGHGTAAGDRRRRLGAVRPGRLDTGQEPRRRAAGAARPPPAPVPHRGGQVQRPAARRPPRGAVQRRSGRAPAADPRHTPDPVRRHGPAVRELAARPQEQVARGDRRGRRPRWRGERHDRRPGRRVRRMEPVRARWPAGVLLQPVRAPAVQDRTATDPVPAGDHQVRVEFAYDGGGLGKGGTAASSSTGAKVGEGRVDATVPMVFSADETADVGDDSGDAGDRRPQGREGAFTGRVKWVQIDLGEDAEDADHLISPEERYRIAMARQ